MINQPFIFFITVVACCIYSRPSYSQAPTEVHTQIVHTQIKDSLINERFSVNRDLLEKHWQIDCDQAVATTLSWLTEQKITDQKDWDLLPWKDLNYCGLLFNTVNTGRHEPCPNYAKAHQLLLTMRQATTDFDPSLISHTLSTQCTQQ